MLGEEAWPDMAVSYVTLDTLAMFSCTVHIHDTSISIDTTQHLILHGSNLLLAFL